MTHTCWPHRLSMKCLSSKHLTTKCRSLRRFMPRHPASPPPPTSTTEHKPPPNYIPTHAVASFLRTTTPSIKQQNAFLDQLSIIRYSPSQSTLSPSDDEFDEKIVDDDNTDEKPIVIDPFRDPVTVPITVLHHTFRRTTPHTLPRDQARALRAALPDPDTFYTDFRGQAEWPRAMRGSPASRDSVDLHRLRLGNHSSVWSEA